MFSHAWEVTVLDWNGTYYTDYTGFGTPNNSICARGTPPTTNLTYWTNYSVFGSPAVGDLDGNGQVEVVIGGAQDVNNPNRGRLYAWTGHKNGSRPWPMYHHDAAHTGRYDIVPPINPSGFSTNQSLFGGQQTYGPIRVQWSVPGFDADSGLSGYATVWVRNAATSPGSTINLSALSTESTYNAAPGGNWYLHIRSIDKVGNPAPALVHIGPFTSAPWPYTVFLPLIVR